MRIRFQVTLLAAALQSLYIVHATINHEDAQIEWVRSKGGYFNPKLEFQLLDPNDPNSPRGVFATQDIARGESVMIIPKSCLLTAGPRSNDPCDTARHLMYQVELGEQSDFAPYINYLFSLKPGNLPSSWSKDGKRLISNMLGKELYAAGGMTSVSYENTCDGSGDAFEEQAFMLVHSRSWDDKMIPLYDMINHRSGHWANVDSNSVHAGRDVLIFAFRDIKAGEQIQYSYYNCADCNAFAHSYGAHDLVKDFGFVEQFPQRWHFTGDYGDSYISFDLDEVLDTSGEKELIVQWITDPPETTQLNYLRGHLKRLDGLKQYIYDEAVKLTSDHEKDVTLAYYEALTAALREAIWASTIEFESALEVCKASEDGNTMPCDGLEPREDPLEYEGDTCGGDNIGHGYVERNFKTSASTQSLYQEIYIAANDNMGDACIYLNDWMQSCASFRPHYHEVLIHYSARFLQSVKRIIFIGGGDLMILHEIMKYSSLELVVGMELDQQVVRTSFQHFGILPQWDNDKMQWWYGDATKSLRMLPAELYGTFDLVVLDLQNYVVDVLDVQDGLSILDTAQLLMAPHGIIAKNEDFFPRKDPDFTDYTVDLNYHDVPILCQQGITMGSNVVDFANAKRKDHKIETIFLDTVDDMKQSHFNLWYNYGTNSSRTNRPCQKAASPDVQSTVQTSSLGIMMILEVENVGISLDISSIQTKVGIAMSKAGMTGVSTSHLEVEEETGHMIVFVAREGYVVARSWPEHKYCAFDILHWGNFDKVDIMKDELIEALESPGGKSSSSYRMVTGGMFGTKAWKEDSMLVGPRVNKLCADEITATKNGVGEIDGMSSVFRESVSLVQDDTIVIVVLCAEKAAPCASLEFLENADDVKKVIPIWTCPSVAQDIMACENDTVESLTEAVNSNGKINMIVIDLKAPRVNGQMLYQLLLDGKTRRKLLADSHVAVGMTQNPSDKWRKELLERFRTDFAMFAPAFRAEIMLKSATTSVELGIFSCGDSYFYAHALNVLPKIEKATGLVAQLKMTKNGIVNYVADFVPSMEPTLTDYNNSLAYEQWMSQQPIGHQTIFQFDLIGPKLPVNVDEPVIIEDFLFMHRGSISRQRKDGTYDVVFADGRSETRVDRGRIRRTEAPDTEEPPAVTMQQLQNVFQRILRSIKFQAKGTEVKVFDEMGDGCVIVSLGLEGSAILSWDGRNHFDVNLFTYQENLRLRDSFLEYLKDEIPFVVTTGQDEQPRGLGRVVNFKSTLHSRDKRVPRWMEKPKKKNKKRKQ